MALHTEHNMEDVAAPGEIVPAGNYHVRVSKVEEKDSTTSGQPIAIFQCKIQDDGPQFGRMLFIIASLQPHALFSLKAVYNAAGYKPGAEGHDPEQVLDSEFYVKVEIEKDPKSGEDRNKIPPNGIRSLSKGVARL